MNAILLAAGFGSRFGEITKHIHKSLLPINGTPNIERTIIFLRNSGVKNIVIVTGYLKEQFEYLQSKYNCNLVYNEMFDTYNNIYSVYKVLNYLGEGIGTYVIDSDVVLLKNIFKKESESKYFLIQRPYNKSKEWNPVYNSDGKIEDIVISNDEIPSLLGISFWTKKDALMIKDKFQCFMTDEHLRNPKLYWDDIPKSILSQLLPSFELLSMLEAVEMDTNDDYERVKGIIQDAI
ncbi:hypothetical protein B9P84_26355 [Citrobacter braakii]|uniref:NTP transferase domain-containing protein n=1 Tax=Citrobacter braakii TaxID=57706 RepID=UPI000B9B09EF|nr:NTP transferase domain-containing protein [Citrobacter braakii]MCY9797025.1 NTP transferase domain-containing protein [Citrobacter braakii]MDL4385189.1 NTP transferase domain-containing protein [Citrobacter braakii]OXU08924.1 hypothetical protein B9P84_26355 [Citrobacter braakii]